MKNIWITLILLTLFAFLLGWMELVNSMIVGLLLITTSVKGQLVIDYFMGLKGVELKYRLIPSVWLILVISAIALFYYCPVID